MPADEGPLPPALQQPKSRWVPVRWSELPGFSEDALHEAWNAWTRSCERPGAAFAALCPEVRLLSLASGEEQRRWMLQRLQPYRVEPLGPPGEGLLTGYFEPVLTEKGESEDAANSAEELERRRALAETTARAFANVRGIVEAEFGLEGTAFAKEHTHKVKLYKSMRRLQSSICFAYEDPLGGWNEPGEPIKLLASANTTIEGLQGVLSHEYGHCCTFELGASSNLMPWWVLEGTAELVSQAINGKPVPGVEGATLSGGTGSPNSRVERWAKRGSLAEWEDLADFEVVPDRLHGNVYTQGHHLMQYITQKVGREGRVKWLTAMAKGKKIDEATREVMGMGFAELDREWRGSLPKPEEEKAEGGE